MLISRCYLYVPEVHPDTGTVLCEREDEGHVLKVRMRDTFL